MARARQADVAREAGVSQSTVSMVLAGGADVRGIPPETQRKVLNAARKLKYLPTRSSRAVASPRGLVVGVHTFDPIFPIDTRDYYFGFLQGIEEEAVAAGCNLMLFTATASEDGVRRIYSGGVNGLRQATGSLLLGLQPHREELVRLRSEGYPFVYVGHREVAGADIAYVGGDYRATTARIVEELVALGHQRIAYLGEAGREEPQADRWSGYADALARLELPALAPTFTSAADLTVAWLDEVLTAGATALLVESVSLARVLAALTSARGVRIPSDLSVVALVDDPIGVGRATPWACLEVPRKEMGRQALRLLVTMLTDPAGEYDQHVLVPCAYSLENTVAPR